MYEKYDFIHPLFRFETLNYKNYSCPHCGSSDRNRLYALYLNERLDEKGRETARYNFLDIAPDSALAVFIRSFDNISYRSVDLAMKGVDDIADITNLDIYSDNSFDIILCSHVLEHITDDRKALGELYRVLRPGGFAIIMAPVLLDLENDFEDNTITTVSGRWKYFGQDDHVRIYSKEGLCNKMKEAGFVVKQLGIDHFGEQIFEKNGIGRKAVLYIAEK